MQNTSSLNLIPNITGCAENGREAGEIPCFDTKLSLNKSYDNTIYTVFCEKIYVKQRIRNVDGVPGSIIGLYEASTVQRPGLVGGCPSLLLVGLVFELTRIGVH